MVFSEMQGVVPYGQGTARGLGASELGVHGVEMDALVGLGLPVVPGLTVTTSHAAALATPELARAAVTLLEGLAHRHVGDGRRLMLLRLTASAAVPATGLPADIASLGLSRSNVEEMVQVIGRAPDVYVAWSAMLRAVAEGGLHVPADDLDDLLFDVKDPAEQVDQMLAMCQTQGDGPMPDDPAEQLALAARSMIDRWASPRAQRARRTQGLDPDLGIALHVQAIRIGHWERSGYGTASSRDSETGLGGPRGRYFPGVRREVLSGPAGLPLEQVPGGFEVLEQALMTLEHRLGAVADVTFSLRDGELALLSASPAPRPGAIARLRLSTEHARSGAITRASAVRAVAPLDVQEILHSQLALTGHEELFVEGLPASPGAACGIIALSAEAALDRAAEGEPVVLVAAETNPADVPALLAAQAVLTSSGGLASHAAVVARGAGRPAVCGAAGLQIDRDAGTVTVGALEFREGDVLSLDGQSGRVYVGPVEVRQSEPPDELDELLGWADDLRALQVRTNADTGTEAAVAVRLGAQGIGLCRTEHQFLGSRLPLIRRFILADDEPTRLEALAALGEAQREDFRDLLLAMGDRPVTVRLLDAPLHEFIPADGDYEDQRQAAKARSLQESNSMLGLRGVRLAIVHEDLYPTQVEALVRAWADVAALGPRPTLEIMVPMVSLPEELDLALLLVRQTIERVSAELGLQVPYLLGSMVETPRAALLAHRLAAMCDFLSFGTNDLTQLTYGFSRDDVEKHVLGEYLQRGLLSASPFAELDASGVGELVALAVRRAREVKPRLKLGVCGEHGGDPASISLLQTMGLDYVSCSPHRVPVARLAAAHAALHTQAAGAESGP